MRYKMFQMMTIHFLFSVPYHVIGKLETAADDFQVAVYVPPN